MSEGVLPPNACLLAIILITKTREGTSEVFHYPLHPGSGRHRRRAGSVATTPGASDDSSSSRTSDSSDEEDYAAHENLNYQATHRRPGSNPNQAGKGKGKHGEPRNSESGSASSEQQAHAAEADAGESRTSGNGSSSGDHGDGRRRIGYLGLPAGYHHFLCPPSTFNKRRFELTIDQLVFLGRPAYAREDGTWRKERKGDDDTRSKSAKRPASTVKTVGSAGGLDGGSAVNSGTASPVPATSRRRSVQLDGLLDVVATGSEGEGDSSAAEQLKESQVEEVPGLEPGYGHDFGPSEAEMEREKRQKDKKKAKMSKEALHMFNVVFVLNPSPSEYQKRVDDMYKFVVKKFCRALQWEQTRSGFVSKESEKIKHLKSKNVAIDQIAKQSRLAKAIAEVFLSISASKIAQVDLSPRTSFSVQLPLPTSISILPSIMEPQLPGIWLTTSNTVASTDVLDVDISTSRSRLAAHFALLLLAPPATIIAEVFSANSPLAPKLAQYLKYTKPTKSFVQISQASGIPIADVQFLASHLIYWRRARAVPPLHHRDIYITSPNADMKRLRGASSQFSRAFPALPTLPKMLSLLSAGPRPYSTFIPSKDHKEAYMEILAWLLQGGWVTQLRSYAWVRVSSEIRERAKDIAKIEERIREERQRRALLKQRQQSEDSTTEGTNESESESESATDTSTDDENSSSAQSNLGDPGEADLPSGHLTPMNASIYSTNSGDSVESARTTIPVRSKPSHSHLSTVENADYDEPMQSSRTEKDVAQTPVLILSPARASGLETRYLTAIAARIEEEDGYDARQAWESCLKYFNGEHAMEKVAVREGWKRKKVEALRARWRSRGILLEVRHW